MTDQSMHYIFKLIWPTSHANDYNNSAYIAVRKSPWNHFANWLVGYSLDSLLQSFFLCFFVFFCNFHFFTDTTEQLHNKTKPLQSSLWSKIHSPRVTNKRFFFLFICVERKSNLCSFFFSIEIHNTSLRVY